MPVSMVGGWKSRTDGGNHGKTVKTEFDPVSIRHHVSSCPAQVAKTSQSAAACLMATLAGSDLPRQCQKNKINSMTFQMKI
ncbi:hypothetical protein [Pseudogulbenkiania sp. MAI-1]|uniref:hypothetical protein n=1 Tax=Pseudogulbenkiania sp. MAI-1 TaxID=990370 RepID=UPI0018DB9E92|nr:hypothetical protein [Pseudogulbenkiania sp. MAI-1]